MTTRQCMFFLMQRFRYIVCFVSFKPKLVLWFQTNFKVKQFTLVNWPKLLSKNLAHAHFRQRANYRFLVNGIWLVCFIMDKDTKENVSILWSIATLATMRAQTAGTPWTSVRIFPSFDTSQILNVAYSF